MVNKPNVHSLCHQVRLQLKHNSLAASMRLLKIANGGGELSTKLIIYRSHLGTMVSRSVLCRNNMEHCRSGRQCKPGRQWDRCHDHGGSTTSSAVLTFGSSSSSIVMILIFPTRIRESVDTIQRTLSFVCVDDFNTGHK